MSRAELGPPSPGDGMSAADSGQTIPIDIEAHCTPDRAGGDLFDTVQVGARMVFILSDIAGRRPEIDPISAEMKRVFRASTRELFSPTNVNLMEVTEMLTHAINQALIEAAKGVRFAPTMIGCYDAQLGILAYVNAGGQTALFRDSESTRALPNASVPLGLFSHLPYDASIQAFEPGAMLLVVTKGVMQGKGGKGGVDPEMLSKVLRDVNSESANVVSRAVLKAANDSQRGHWNWLPFRGRRMLDDMTALAVVRPAS